MISSLYSNVFLLLPRSSSANLSSFIHSIFFSCLRNRNCHESHCIEEEIFKEIEKDIICPGGAWGTSKPRFRTALHYTTLHYVKLHSVPLTLSHCTVLHDITPHHFSLLSYPSITLICTKINTFEDNDKTFSFLEKA